MSPRFHPDTPGNRESVQARVRHLTRAAIFAAAGATVAIGVVVAHEHPGASAVRKGTTTSGSKTGTGSATGGSSSSDTSGTTGSTGDTGTTGTTGNTGSSAPSSSSSTPVVTSGGTSS